MRDSMSCTYEITSPIGEKFITNRLKDFCKQHNLATTTMYINYNSDTIAIKGRNKGWKCTLIKD